MTREPAILRTEGFENMKFVIKRGDISTAEFLFILCVVFDSGTLLKQENNIAVYGMIFFGGIYFVKHLRTILNSKRILICTLILFLLLGLWIIQFSIWSSENDTFIALISFFLQIYFPFVFCLIESRKNYARFICFIKIEMFFSVISTILFCGMLAGINLPTISLEEDGFGKTILYLEHYMIATGYIIPIRNCGIFWEGGMYQIYLNLLLIYYLYISESKYKKAIIIYLIALVITTGSTTGAVLCPMIIVYYLFTNKIVSIKQLLVILIGIVALFYARQYIQANIQDKFTKGVSHVVRVNDIFWGFEVFLKNPILGHGLINSAYSNLYLKRSSKLRGNTNGLLNLLINFGAVGTAVYFVLFSGFMSFIKRRAGKKCMWIFAVWFMVSICTEPITVHPSIIFLLGLGLTKEYRAIPGLELRRRNC